MKFVGHIFNIVTRDKNLKTYHFDEKTVTNEVTSYLYVDNMTKNVVDKND